MTKETETLIERLESHMGKADVGDLLRDCRLAAKALAALEASNETLRAALANVRAMLEVEYHDDGRIACVAHESGGLREMVRLLDATLARSPISGGGT